MNKLTKQQTNLVIFSLIVIIVIEIIIAIVAFSGTRETLVQKQIRLVLEDVETNGWIEKEKD
jgi:Tfp pilus assembly protein PilX